MKAILCKNWGLPDTLTVEELPDPVPAAGQVGIDVQAAGVNFPDVLIIQNKYQFKPELPFSPGSELAGVVRAVGAGVTQFKPGDRVIAFIGHGAFAQQVVAPVAAVMPMPPGMDFDTAAAITLTYGTSYHAVVDRAQLKAGETMLVLGAAGGVGLAAVQIAKGFGATVLAGVNHDEQARLALANGADHVIRLDAGNLRETLRQQVHAATAGHGADVVLDTLGGDVFDASLRAMAWRGRMVVIGFAAGRIPEIKANYLLVKNIQVAGLQWSDYRERDPAWVRRVQDELFGLYVAGKIKPNVMRSFALEDFAAALALVKAGKVQGKVVLTTAPAGSR